MNTTRSRLGRALYAHQQTIGAVLAVVLLTNTFVVARHAFREGGSGSTPLSLANDGGIASTLPGATGLPSSARAVPGSTAPGSKLPVPNDVRTAPPGTFIPGKGTVPLGLDGNKIKVIYYWKANETMSSQFLAGTGKEGNVDEGLAFTTLMKWVNKHANDGSELMGFKFDLGDWRFDFDVINAGKADDQQRAGLRLRDELKPFAAVSSHGSVSAVVCPIISKAGIFNISTFDLNWGLAKRTNGYCLPQGLSWDAQVDLTVAYLKAQNATPYQSATGPVPRRYGLLLAEYDDEMRAAPRLERMIREAGINLVDKAQVDDDLTTAGRQQPRVVAQFVGSDVNTIIAPDSGSLITFTHAAAGAGGYHPDYYVWPCSGQDSTGMVRLYDANQWSRARGLTCYDEHLNADLTNDDIAKASEWYKAYQEIAGSDADPPAPTSLVYQSLLPLVAGITYAGKDLTVERFKQGMSIVRPYRYDAIAGRSRTTPLNILVTIGSSDFSQVGDAGEVRWDNTITTPGNATPGTYVFIGDRRYRRGAVF